MTDPLTKWSIPKLSAILPLDEESLTQLISYSLTLPKGAAAEHLKSVLGDSPRALEFVSSFNSRRDDTAVAPAELKGNDGDGGGGGVDDNSRKNQRNRKSKPPLHSAGPARRPDGYGNVAGGYHKADFEESYVPGQSPSSRRTASPAAAAAVATATAIATNSTSAVSGATQLSSQPEAFQLPTTTSIPSSNLSSRTASSAPSSVKSKPPPSVSGPLISDNLFTNVRSRTRKTPTPKSTSQPQSHSASPARRPHTSVNDSGSDEISDLTVAISLLERTTNPSKTARKVTCNCNATLHPLFTPAPNCLSCGKIICALEGNNLQPCSFCNTPLLTPQQTQAMIATLRSERGIEKMAVHNAAAAAATAQTPKTDLDDSLTKAEEHKNKLLSFQRENARRTKVVDEVAEFDAPEVSSWMTPVERAKALKAQQKYAREMEEKNKPEWERKKMVMSLDVSGGKVRRMYNKVESSSSLPRSPGDEDSEEEGSADEGVNGLGGEGEEARRGGTFAQNPLLEGVGGKVKLVRPIWKVKNKGKGSESGEKEGVDRMRDRTTTWRRVQDDNDDGGERWILNGGIHGFDVASEWKSDEPA